MERNQFYGRRLYQPEPGGIAVAEGDLSTAQSNDSEQEEHFLRKIDRRCAVLQGLIETGCNLMGSNSFRSKFGSTAKPSNTWNGKC
jgi:hypothetical protein